jgi:curved DNA-binding protein CbpA
MSNQNHYQNLGLNHDAKPEAIVAAHAALTEKCRAELRPNADASRYLTAIDTALAVLCDPQQRAAYDQQLLSGPQNIQAEVKAPAVSKSASAKPKPAASKAKPKTVASIAREVASKAVDAPILVDVPRKNQFPLALSIAIAAVLGLAWFGYSKLTTEPDAPTASELSAPAISEATLAEAPSTVAPVTDDAASEDNSVRQLTELSYDAASIDQFIGAWQGQNESSARQTLVISQKSTDSLVFNLKTKAGNNLGEIVGVADFENGLARFFNAEYGCRLLITRTGKQLNVNSSGCQAFYQKGAEFDGAYAKPENSQPVQTASKTVTKANKPIVNTEQAKQMSAPAQISSAPNAPAANPGKLYRFVATVKNAEGKTERIELVAANEEAARDILRNFRGNPKVVRIRKAWF